MNIAESREMVRISTSAIGQNLIKKPKLDPE